MADLTDVLPAVVTLQLVRQRDGRFRLTAEATGWPGRVRLSNVAVYQVACEVSQVVERGNVPDGGWSAFNAAWERFPV